MGVMPLFQTNFLAKPRIEPGLKPLGGRVNLWNQLLRLLNSGPQQIVQKENPPSSNRRSSEVFLQYQRNRSPKPWLGQWVSGNDSSTGTSI